MLKIKKNVDLKELEKFGFKQNEVFVETFDYEFLNSDNLISSKMYPLKEPEKDYGNMCISNNNGRKINIHSNGYLTVIPNVLYDLIKADLVEKVED